MLTRMLILVLIWLILSSAVLVAAGQRLRGPSRKGSLTLILFVEVAGAALGMALFGALPLEVGVAVVVSTALGQLVIQRYPAWNPAGHAAWLFLAESAAIYLAVAAVLALLAPTNPVEQVVGLLLLALQVCAVVLTLSYTYELTDVVCRRLWRRPEGCPPRLASQAHADNQAHSTEAAPQSAGTLPRVAIQVPCHNEPVDVVESTLQALARLDYPRDRYTVLVVDNNTTDAVLWVPLARLCEELGFTFLHLEAWPGFKSGALNYALAVTPPEYDLIGVVDADYFVDPAYLRDLVGYFDDPQVAFVQTPQDYRDYGPNSTFFQHACYHAYRYFFDVSMPSRNERNAIIFAGTMGLLRAGALRAIGGWDEWCITEDAEASVRLLARGYEGRFVNHAYGRGLMPLEFDALKQQRFRWCFGGIQILRKHWATLMPWTRRAQPAADWEAPGLTASQRYFYLLGGLQWYSDVLTFGFTALLLLTSLLLLLGHPAQLPVLGGPLLLLPVTFWATSLLRTLWGLRATRRCTWGEALGAVAVLWSMGWVVTLASLQGALRPRGVFLRTPKVQRANLLRVLSSTTAETLLGGACWVVGLALLGSHLPSVLAGTGAQRQVSEATAGGMPWWLVDTSATVLGVLALLQGCVYLAAPALCLASLRTEVSAREAQRQAQRAYGNMGTYERGLALGAVLSAAVLLLLVGGAGLLPHSPHSLGPGRQHTLSSLLGSAPSTATPGAGGTSNPGAGGTPTPLTTASPSGLPLPTGSPLTPLTSGTPLPLPSVTPLPLPTATLLPLPTVTPPLPVPTLRLLPLPTVTPPPLP
jgi:cellulose synthase/poly-beta-1,6-N-acetylglucosamine synthase-like glycosyltransferase